MGLFDKVENSKFSVRLQTNTARVPCGYGRAFVGGTEHRTNMYGKRFIVALSSSFLIVSSDF